MSLVGADGEPKSGPGRISHVVVIATDICGLLLLSLPNLYIGINSF